MNFKTKIAMVVGCMLLAVACSQESEDLGGSTSTRQSTGGENTHRRADTDDDDEFAETGADPVVSFYSVDEEDSVEVMPGESATAQAPLDMLLEANISNPDNYNYVCEWRVWNTNKGSEFSPLVTRFEENTTYTLTKAGGYGIKLYVTFSLDGDTIEFESDPITVSISESKLTCPDAFTPNNDSINDTYRITAQSIVKLDAKFFNRWGEKVHSVTLATAKRVEGEPNKLVLWDGKQGGKYVTNGMYLLNLYGLGSDGREYKIKKSISVVSGYREGTETEGGGGSGS